MNNKYDNIGAGYNSTRQADPYITERILFLLNPKREKLYLDLGCGTGNYTCVLADKGVRLTGVDPSEKMLSVAKERNQQIKWLEGTAEQIPSGDQAFEGVISTLTIHHWTDLKKAFSEINRVLTDKGRFVLFTSTSEQMRGYWLNHYFPEMLHASIIQMPSFEAIKQAAEAARLKINYMEKYFIQDDLQDCFLYVGKNHPEYYFDEKIRNGISSFSSLANIAEVKQGLEKLRNDIDNRTFENIRHEYESDLGDYLFMTMHKY
jgi:ubiquinone/menaquinone biosynthesis C-methylase UbiE